MIISFTTLITVLNYVAFLLLAGVGVSDAFGFDLLFCGGLDGGLEYPPSARAFFRSEIGKRTSFQFSMKPRSWTFFGAGPGST